MQGFRKMHSNRKRTKYLLLVQSEMKNGHLLSLLCENTWVLWTFFLLPTSNHEKVTATWTFCKNEGLCHKLTILRSSVNENQALKCCWRPKFDKKPRNKSLIKSVNRQIIMLKFGVDRNFTDNRTFPTCDISKRKVPICVQVQKEESKRTILFFRYPSEIPPKNRNPPLKKTVA